MSELEFGLYSLFISSKLSEDLSEIKKIYSSIGYNFTTVDAKIEKFENNRINIVYFLERGEKTVHVDPKKIFLKILLCRMFGFIVNKNLILFTFFRLKN